MANISQNNIVLTDNIPVYTFQGSSHSAGNSIILETNPKRDTKRKSRALPRDRKCFELLDKMKSSNSSMKTTIVPRKYSASELKTSRSDPCGVCKKKKCYKHLDQKLNGMIAKKMPEETVLQIKRQMLKILSVSDFTPFYKDDPRHTNLEVDIGKMYNSYIEEHEPLIAQALATNDSSTDTKPKVKLWLYRKIFLDEFKTYDYSLCKQHLCDLRRTLESNATPKKKKTTKSKNQTQIMHQTNQNRGQEFSIANQPMSNQLTDQNTRTVPQTVSTCTVSSVGSTPPSYQQTGNLMNLGVESSSSGHLNPYIPPQVSSNLLFGLSSPQTPQLAPMPQPTQQQPLNLQTSPQPQHLPLNLHNHPYYVSFAPMLPIHVQQQHPHTQQFQQTPLVPHQPPIASQGFNQHAMYQ